MSPRALRYYEEQRLLTPGRSPGGYREYAETAVHTVGHIRLLLSAGLGTTVIAGILPCVPDEATTIPPTCPDLIDGLVGERTRITGSIDKLLAARAVLDRLIDVGRAA